MTTVVALAAGHILRIAYEFYRQWIKLKNIPSPPAPSFFWGHSQTWLSTRLPMQLADWTAKYGSVYRIRFLHRWAVVVTDPTLVRAVLQVSRLFAVVMMTSAGIHDAV